MEQAAVIAAFQSTEPPRLKDLLIDVDAKPRGPMTGAEMKAIFAFALPANDESTNGRKQRDRRAPRRPGAE